MAKRKAYVFNLPTTVRDQFEMYAASDLQSAPALGTWAPVAILPAPEGAELIWADLAGELDPGTDERKERAALN